jgi:hypothetical protein
VENPKTFLIVIGKSLKPGSSTGRIFFRDQLIQYLMIC